MKKANRLTKASDFKAVLDQRHCAGKNKSMSVYYAANSVGYARIGLSVSVKMGNAVTRVRVRRQLRAQINLSDILEKPFDIVIIARPGYLRNSFEENAKILRSCLGNLSSRTTEEQK